MGRFKRFLQSLTLDKLVVWSSLSRFGNSPLAKAALLAPIVAIFVQLNDVYLAQTFGFQNAIWLYWSLISIGVGQILFSLKCPKSIRIYGNDQERFVLEAKASWTMNQLDEAARDKLRHFLGYDGLSSLDDEVLQLSDKESIQVFFSRRNPQLAGNVVDDLAIGLPALRRILMGEPRVEGESKIAAAAVSWLLSLVPDSVVLRQKDLNRSAVLADQKQFVHQMIQTENTSLPTNRGSLWIVPALNCRYELQNRDGRAFRWAVAGFYGSGFLYFVWRAMASFASMTDATIKAIF